MSNPAAAQFINLHLEIEPELSATVEQTLNFGTQITNSGTTEIQLGDVNMGIFSIRAFSNQQVFFELNYPDYLKHINSTSDDQIPLVLNMSYNNSGTNSYTNAQLLEDDEALITMSGGNNSISSDSIWSILYIYVFGAIDVDNIPNGVYTADIILSVDYN